MKRTLSAAFILLLALVAGACSSDSAEDGELIITDLQVGDGQEAIAGQTLIVEYVGKFADGTVFDSTEEAGEDFIFTLGVRQVIQGWDEGLRGMKVGGTRRLEIPSYMAFGRTGQCFSSGECAVPPNTDVIYDVTLVDIFDFVMIEDVEEGDPDGQVAETGDFVIVNYVGQLADGSVFDASASHGGFFGFVLGRGSVIAGWDQGIPGMRVGGRRVLTVPPVLGYGRFGAGSTVPPFAVLTFTIDLEEVRKPDSTG